MTRAEYVAPAHRRRAEAQDMRRSGISVREIAHVLAVSVREVYRLLESVVVALVQAHGWIVGVVCAGFARPIRLYGCCGFIARDR